MSTIPDPPNTLVDAIKNRKAFAIVGSGLSSAVGAPNWPDLLADVAATAAETQPREVKKIHSALKAIDGGRLLNAADLLKDILVSQFGHAVVRAIQNQRNVEPNWETIRIAAPTDARSLFKTIQKEKISERPLLPSESHRLLLHLNFRAVLTTNYDHLLEDASTSARSKGNFYSYSYSQLPQRMRSSDWFLLKIHGDLGTPEELILARSDYSKPIFGEPLRESLRTLFLDHYVFWIGYGHNDLNLPPGVRQTVKRQCTVD